MVGLKAPIAMKVTRDDAQDRITLSRRQITFHDFRQPSDSLRKLQSDLRILRFEPDAGKHGEASTYLCRVKNSNVPINDTRILQQPYTAETRRR